MPALITAGIGAAASVVNNTVNNLFQAGKIKAQTDQINLQTRLAQLSNSQQQVLALKLQAAQTQDDQLQILNDAAASIISTGVTGNANILSAAVQNQGTNSLAIAGIIIASGVLLVAGLYFLNKKS